MMSLPSPSSAASAASASSASSLPSSSSSSSSSSSCLPGPQENFLPHWGEMYAAEKLGKAN